MPLGLLKDPSAIGAEIRETQDAIGALAHPHLFFAHSGKAAIWMIGCSILLSSMR